MSLKKTLRKCLFLTFLYDKIKQFYYKCLIYDKRIIEKRFKERLNRKVELENPIKYNDKLQWLKLYWRDPLATKCADKYEVRNIIKRKIGKEYLNEVLAVYTSVDDIDINELPDSFALKCTHGSGYNIICKDKNKLDWKKAKRQLKRWMKTNYYLQNREWVYKDI